MTNLRWMAAAAAAALAAGASAQDNAQEPAAGAVGPPQLRDFELPGQRTVPDAAAPTPLPTLAPPAPARTPPVRTPAPEPTARATPPRPAPEPPAAVEPEPETSAPAPAPVTAAPIPTAPEAAPPVPAPETISPAPAPQNAGDWSRAWLLVPAALLLALVGWLVLRRRGEPEEELVEEPALPKPPELPAEPPLPPMPGPPALTGTVGVTLRAQIDIDVVAESVSAGGEEEAVVEFALLLRNSGNAAAHDIRVEAKLFNGDRAGEREIANFMAAPLSRGREIAMEPLAPRTEQGIGGSVDMPRADLRPIDADGRQMFVPVIAVTVIYGWGDGRTGQTSLSYILGRERAGEERMGPFTLQAGARTWRDVGRRQNRLLRVL